MKVLLWTPASTPSKKTEFLWSSAGHVVFRESQVANLLFAARQEEPTLIVFDRPFEHSAYAHLSSKEQQASLPSASPAHEPTLEMMIDALTTHPDTRWIPILALINSQIAPSKAITLLQSGVSAVINLSDNPDLIEAQAQSFSRLAYQMNALRSKRFIDETTGFYHQSFLEDQLKIYCRKNRRDGIPFCLIFFELRGREEDIQKAAINLAATVRGADLFGLWENQTYAVLLPAGTPAHAHLLCERFKQILAESDLDARCSLIASGQGTIEPEALVELAQNTLDSAWQESGPLLWTWDNTLGSGIPAPAI